MVLTLFFSEYYIDRDTQERMRKRNANVKLSFMDDRSYIKFF